MRAVRTVMLLGLVSVGWGCPRSLDVPSPPPGVQKCTNMSDCNSASCGVLRACVGGLCEAPDAGTIVVPCRDGGVFDAG